jgi:hypothetical protein
MLLRSVQLLGWKCWCISVGWAMGLLDRIQAGFWGFAVAPIIMSALCALTLPSPELRFRWGGERGLF